jgi:hypothetical protein
MFMMYLTFAFTRFVMTVNRDTFFTNARAATGGSMIPQNISTGE